MNSKEDFLYIARFYISAPRRVQLPSQASHFDRIRNMQSIRMNGSTRKPIGLFVGDKKDKQRLM